jgi:drug/metabolite transporter (DMT)-like permease
MPASSQHRIALAQAFFVTFLWSTSWVLIKFGLEAMSPLVFAGLRYGLATLILLPFVLLSAPRRRSLGELGRNDWMRLCALGVLMIAVTQGAQFVALASLPAVVLSLSLCCTPLVVAALSLPLLGEPPRRLQFLGMALFVVGAWTYLRLPGLITSLTTSLATVGLVAAGVCVAAGAASSLLGRHVNRHGLDALVVTTVSMAVGSSLLLGAGLAIEGRPAVGLRSWLIIAWLAAVNTALAFTLWNRSLRHLSATESSVVNNTMLIQIACLALIFLGEGMTWQQAIGLVIASLGAWLVQARPRAPARRSWPAPRTIPGNGTDRCPPPCRREPAGRRRH